MLLQYYVKSLGFCPTKNIWGKNLNFWRGTVSTSKICYQRRDTAFRDGVRNTGVPRACTWDIFGCGKMPAALGLGGVIFQGRNQIFVTHCIHLRMGDGWILDGLIGSVWSGALDCTFNIVLERIHIIDHTLHVVRIILQQLDNALGLLLASSVIGQLRRFYGTADSMLTRNLPQQTLSKCSDREQMMTLWTGSLSSPHSITKSEYFSSTRRFANPATSSDKPWIDLLLADIQSYFLISGFNRSEVLQTPSPGNMGHLACLSTGMLLLIGWNPGVLITLRIEPVGQVDPR